MGVGRGARGAAIVTACGSGLGSGLCAPGACTALLLGRAVIVLDAVTPAAAALLGF